jgi:hypothetical protein
MPKGGRLRLMGAVDPATDGVVIMVQDEGIGIAPDELEGLFQPFHGGFAQGAASGSPSSIASSRTTTARFRSARSRAMAERRGPPAGTGRDNGIAT